MRKSVTSNAVIRAIGPAALVFLGTTGACHSDRMPSRGRAVPTSSALLADPLSPVLKKPVPPDVSAPAGSTGSRLVVEGNCAAERVNPIIAAAKFGFDRCWTAATGVLSASLAIGANGQPEVLKVNAHPANAAEVDCISWRMRAMLFKPAASRCLVQIRTEPDNEREAP